MNLSCHLQLKNFFLLIILCFIFIQVTYQARLSIPMQLAYNPYFTTGNYKLSSITAFSNYFTISYDKSKLSVINMVNFYLSLQQIDFRYNGLLSGGSFLGRVANFQTSVTASTLTYFQLKIYVNGFSLGNQIKVGYLIIDNQFPLAPYIYHYHKTSSVFPNTLTIIFPSFSKPTKLVYAPFLTVINFWKSNTDTNYFFTGFQLSISQNPNNLTIDLPFAQQPFYISNIKISIMAAFVPQGQPYKIQAYSNILISLESNRSTLISLPYFEYQQSKYLMGILSFIFQSYNTSSSFDNAIMASFWFDGMIIYPNIGFSSCSQQFKTYAYSFVYINYYDCLDPIYPFKSYNQNSSQYQCFNSCQDRFYESLSFNTSYYYQSGACEPCFYTCLTCRNAYTCDSCDEINNHRVLTYDGQCIPAAGYFQPAIANISAQLCSSICLECYGLADNCTLCNETLGYFLQSQTCQICSNFIQYCVRCINSTVCLQCQPGKQLIFQDQCRIINNSLPIPVVCTFSNCSQCLLSNLSFCLVCFNPQILPINGLCIASCGDGKIVYPQQCDDGNNYNFDGCSEFCLLEQHFQCIQVPINNISSFNKSICKYNETIKIVFQQIQKLQNQNTIIVYLHLMNPIIKAWQIISQQKILKNFFSLDLNQTKFISQLEIVDAFFLPDYLNKSYSNTNFNRLLQQLTEKEYVSSFSYIALSLKYFKNIEKFNLYFFPQTYQTSQIFNNVSQVEINIGSVYSLNNLQILYYSENIYQIASLLYYICTVIGLITLIMLLVSMFFGNKLIAIQTAAVMQLCFLSLTTLNYLSATQWSLAQLKYSMGYNLQITKTIQQQQFQNNNERIRQLLSVGINIEPIDNFNLSFLLMVCVVIIGLLMILISKMLRCLKFQQKSKICQNLASLTVGSIALQVVLFNTYSFIFFSLTYISQLKTQISSNMLNILICSLSATIFLIYMLLILFSKGNNKIQQLFSEISRKIKNKKWKILHFFIIALQRVIISIILIYTQHFLYQQIFIIGIILFLIIYNLKFKLHSIANIIRVLSNYLIMILIQLSFMYLKITNYYKISQQESDLKINLPITIVILLSLCLLINLVYFVYSIPNLRCCLLQLDKKREKKEKKIQLSQNIENQNEGKDIPQQQVQMSQLNRLFFQQRHKLNSVNQKIQLKENSLNSMAKKVSNSLESQNTEQFYKNKQKSAITSRNIRKQIQKQKLNNNQQKQQAFFKKKQQNKVYEDKQKALNQQNFYKYTGQIYFTLQEYDQI